VVAVAITRAAAMVRVPSEGVPLVPEVVGAVGDAVVTTVARLVWYFFFKCTLSPARISLSRISPLTFMVTQEGHMSRECTEPRKSGPPGGGGGGGGNCYKCNEPGHKSL